MQFRLVFRKGSRADKRTFDKDTVILGRGREEIEGTCLGELDLENEHLIIKSEEGMLTVINQAADPFVTLNDLPFGRKKLRQDDKLFIEDVEIEVSLVEKDSPPAREKPSQPAQSEPVKAAAKAAEPARPILSEDLDDLLQQVNNLGNKKLEPKPVKKTEVKKTEQKEVEVKREPAPPPLPASEEKEPEEQEELAESPYFPTGRWRSWLISGMFAFLILVGAFGTFYLTYSERNDAEEFLAAQELADVAMAFSYAQIHDTVPPNQNWANRDFIHDNLEKVLGRETDLPEINPQGRFKDLPYQLRVYTGPNRYLVMAQPVPSFWQWSIPKETIVIDSSLMDIRKITDVKQLNRLLAVPTPLEGENGEQVSVFIAQASVIPLKQLAKVVDKRNFRPTREIIEVNPSSVQYLYNAPRYFRLTQLMLDTAKDIASATGAKEQDAIKQLMTEKQKLSRLKGLVYYSTLPEADSKKVLTTLKEVFPQETLIMSQLAFDQTGEELLNSYLVESDTPAEQVEEVCAEGVCEAPEPVIEEEIELTPDGDEEELEEEEVEMSFTPTGNLSQQLRNLSTERRENLRPIGDEMIYLIQQHIQSPISDFNERAAALLKQFETIDLSEQSYLQFALLDFYQQYVIDEQILSHDEFQSLARTAGIASFVPPQESEREQWVEQEPIEAIEQTIDQQLYQVKTAESLNALDRAVEAALALNKKLHDVGPEEQTRRSKQIRMEAIRNLEQLLFGSDTLLTSKEFSQDKRPVLVTILNRLELDDSQRIYYLSEFDYVVQALNRSNDEIVEKSD